jgi:pre-mRNA-splicing factor 18
MDLLKKELERKRKTIELAKKSNINGVAYMKAGDLRKIREEQEEERKKKKSNRYEKYERKKRRRDEDTSDMNETKEEKARSIDTNGKKAVASSKTKETKAFTESISDEKNESESYGKGDGGSNDKNKNQISKMSSMEITNALRELGIPVWLFGERDDAQRMLRLQEARDSKKSLMAGISESDDFKLGSGHGIRNPFLGGKKEKEDHDFGLKKSTDQEKAENQEEVDDDQSDPHRSIHRFFKSQLKQWEDDLVNRPDSVKRTLAGKNETKTLKQCKDYIRPLFKQCKNRRLEENMTRHLMNIVRFCKEGEFVRANDAYIDVAIGRAAWPIGVTMVGIHARSGRAKIESSNVAHVMNSEMQRKYLTSVKRLITYCQKKRVDVAPSKKVTNV